GTSFDITVSSATDAYGNGISGTAVVSVTDSDITGTALADVSVIGGAGIAAQIIYTSSGDEVTFEVVLGDLTNYVVLSNVLPADELGSMALASSVSKVTAGYPINADVTLTLYDAYGNLKVNATNSVYFLSSDTNAIFTNDAANVYPFVAGDTGVHLFGDTNFNYFTSGSHDLVVTNVQWGVFDRLAAIDVMADSLAPAGFASSISAATATAGTAFTVGVSSATDTYGNLVTATAVVSVTDSDIVGSALGNISAVDGVGTNPQTIYTASVDEVTLRLVMVDITNYVVLSNVLPADEMGSLALASSVSRVTAGYPINADVTVTLYDIYGNLKRNATNSVFFLSTDTNAVFTNDAANVYPFVAGDVGTHLFGDTNFTYFSAGTHDLVVTNVQWSLFDRLGGIEVVGDPTPAGFASGASVSTGIAGTSFDITVSSATDAYGNPVTGTAVVSVTDSDITGTALADVSVIGGAGIAAQILYTSSVDEVTFEVVLGDLTNYVGLSNVLPADDLGTMDLASTVSVVTAGYPINADVTVTLYDIYGNLKRNATNSVYFLSTDTNAVFTNDAAKVYPFVAGDVGTHLFGDTNFTYFSAGTHDLVVTNVQWSVGQRLGGIAVLADDAAPAGFASSISVATAIAGTSFDIDITSATDAYGNLLANTAVVSVTD
ncbi:MAG: hypothetical protein GY842_00500, partial [bacterium]|nr:hypothetical protein [bacterium]